MNVKVIKGNEDYDRAMARLDSLLDRNPAPGSEEENELELLALVIEDYERKIVPPAEVDPVDAILFRMDQAGLSRKDLVPYIGSPSKVSEVLSRKKRLSLTMIRKLHKGLGIPLESLLADPPENDPPGDVAIAFERFPLAEMRERGCFGSAADGIRNLKHHAEKLVRGFIADLSAGTFEPALLRAPLHQRGDRSAHQEALLAWRLLVIQKARAKNVSAPYRKGTVSLDWLRGLARLSALSSGPTLAIEYLANAGIALVAEPHFRRTYLDGAAMLDRGRPVVGLTLRHDRLDNFWFVLFHELAHVARHLDDTHPFFTDDLESPDRSDRIEKEADELAGDALIPTTIWRDAPARQSHAAADVIALAGQLGIHPAIVAGRIRHESGDFSKLSILLGRGEPRRQLR